jgi:hypothetical protein
MKKPTEEQSFFAAKLFSKLGNSAKWGRMTPEERKLAMVPATLARKKKAKEKKEREWAELLAKAETAP